MVPYEKRFWERVVKGAPEECWEWLGCKSYTGYGSFSPSWERSGIGAHRISWELTYGEIPEGLCVLHKCDNRSCVNPNHLWLGTKSDNLKDAYNKGRAKKQGEHHHLNKLTEEAVVEIRRLGALGLTHEEIASHFPVGRTAITRIIQRKRWTHVG